MKQQPNCTLSTEVARGGLRPRNGPLVEVVRQGSHAKSYQHIPEVIPVEMCYLGWKESLAQLANLVEPEIP
jgi:hypothetical protein